MRVEWFEKALKNLEDEANYIVVENPKAADDFSDAIFDSVDKLAQLGKRRLGETYPRTGSSKLVLSEPV